MTDQDKLHALINALGAETLGGAMAAATEYRRMKAPPPIPGCNDPRLMTPEQRAAIMPVVEAWQRDAEPVDRAAYTVLDGLTKTQQLDLMRKLVAYTAFSAADLFPAPEPVIRDRWFSSQRCDAREEMQVSGTVRGEIINVVPPPQYQPAPGPDTVDGLIAKLQALPADMRKWKVTNLEGVTPQPVVDPDDKVVLL